MFNIEFGGAQEHSHNKFGPKGYKCGKSLESVEYSNSVSWVTNAIESRKLKEITIKLSAKISKKNPSEIWEWYHLQKEYEGKGGIDF